MKLRITNTKCGPKDLCFVQDVVYCGQNWVPRVDTVSAKTKAAFHPIIYWPILDLSWLMLGVNPFQVTVARDTTPPTICSCVTITTVIFTML